MKTILTILSLSLVMSAWGDSENCTGGNNACDLQKLIGICKSLEGNPQIKPFSTELTCGGQETYWELKQSGAIGLQTKLIISNKVSMKGGKYVLPQSSSSLSSDPSIAQCHIYHELIGTFTPVVKTLTSCADLEAVASHGQTAYCKKVIEDSQSPLGEVKPTGKVYNTCGCASEKPLNVLGAELKPKQIQEKDGSWIELEITAITDPSGFIAKLGLSVGDRFVSVNGEQMDSSEKFEAHIRKAITPTRLVYYSISKSQYIEIEI